MSDAPTANTAPEQSGPAQLREALERAQAQNAEKDQIIESLTQAARDSAFDQAGVPADGWGTAFRKTYEGPIALDEIKAEVTAWGIPTPEAAPTQTPGEQAEAPAVAPDEATAIAQAQALRNVPPTPPNSNLAADEFERMLASGDYTREDIARVAANHGLIELSD